jgi:uncharacterized NAD(P)/FAD-binding protein YdhS
MRVAIVGGGFSGTMAAVQLARLGRTEAVLVERRARVAAGAAYSTDEPFHLLNVRAKNMSAFPEAPDHFLAWARREGLGGPEDFVARRDYRRYLEGLLRQAEATGKLRRLRGRAVALDEDADGLVLTVEPGQRLGFERAVLAGGNHPSRLPAALDLPDERRVDDPWGEEGPAALKRIAEQAAGDVLLLGTGLTMVDTALTLAAAGFGGRMLALSRRGLVPRAHEQTGAEPLASQPPARLGELIRRLRSEAGQAGWRPAVDGLRPHAIRLWRGFSEAERRRFLRHARPWWDVHRHRIAPAAAAAIDVLRREGRLEVAAGRIAGARALDGALALTIARRGGGMVEARVAAAVNCTGPEGRIDRVEDPLTCWLLASGLARPDPLGIALDVDHESRLIDGGGRPSRPLFALGPPTRGTFWEIVAVPDIREQALRIARLISS